MPSTLDPADTQKSDILASDLREVSRIIRENNLLLKRVIAILERSDSSQGKTPTSVWTPPREDRGVNARLASIQPSYVTRVEQSDGGLGTLNWLKETWAGRFYLKRLKNYPVIRKIVFWSWTNLYPIYLHLIAIICRNKEMRWRPIVRLSDHAEIRNAPKIRVLNAAKVETPSPEVIPEEDQIHLVSPHDQYEFSPVYVAQLNNGQVYGGTNLVFMEDAVICHDLYDFARDFTSEEMHGRHVIDVRKSRMRLERSDFKPEKMPVAASFLDACAPNYAHWLTEVLPRIAVFCALEQYADVPIIIDDGLHPNIMQSLALVVGHDREIVILPVGRAISVDVLYITSVTGYVPFERRNTKLTRHSHGLFSPLAFDQLRKRLLPYCENSQPQEFPSKIYLRRKVGGRKITNSDEIEEVLTDNGYVIVEPEKLTFLQQLALFSSVDEIVAPSGAALANLIFARPNTRVHILIGRYHATSYWYWQNLASASGKQVIYSLGESRDGQSSIHSDFVIDAGVFRYASHPI